MVLRSVVLPEPLPPMMTKISPRRIWKVRSSITTRPP